MDHERNKKFQWFWSFVDILWLSKVTSHSLLIMPKMSVINSPILVILMIQNHKDVDIITWHLLMN